MLICLILVLAWAPAAGRAATNAIATAIKTSFLMLPLPLSQLPTRDGPDPIYAPCKAGARREEAPLEGGLSVLRPVGAATFDGAGDYCDPVSPWTRKRAAEPCLSPGQSQARPISRQRLRALVTPCDQRANLWPALVALAGTNCASTHRGPGRDTAAIRSTPAAPRPRCRDGQGGRPAECHPAPPGTGPSRSASVSSLRGWWRMPPPGPAASGRFRRVPYGPPCGLHRIHRA